MSFSAAKFNAPKGTESIYGENPYSVKANISDNFDEIIAIQWKITKKIGKSHHLIEENIRIINDGEFNFESIIDVEDSSGVSHLCFSYRLFTSESDQGPQDSYVEFESKVPSKVGAIPVSLSGNMEAQISLEPGGYAKFSCTLRAEEAGDWCLFALLSDQSGNETSSAVLAENGTAALGCGMAGKPKSLSGTVGTLGANDWVEWSAAI